MIFAMTQKQILRKIKYCNSLIAIVRAKINDIEDAVKSFENYNQTISDKHFLNYYSPSFDELKKVYMSVHVLNYLNSIKLVLLTQLDYYVALLSLFTRVSQSGNGDELLFPDVNLDLDSLKWSCLDDLISEIRSLTVGAKL